MDISSASDIRVAVDSAAGVKATYTLSGQYVESGESITLHALGYMYYLKRHIESVCLHLRFRVLPRDRPEIRTNVAV
jgi:hypothetical protein